MPTILNWLARNIGGRRVGRRRDDRPLVQALKAGLAPRESTHR